MDSTQASKEAQHVVQCLPEKDGLNQKNLNFFMLPSDATDFLLSFSEYQVFFLQINSLLFMFLEDESADWHNANSKSNSFISY